MLRFNIGRIPVGIHFSFLLILWIAYSLTNDFIEAGVAGIGILAGILLHEMGHALTARHYGADDVRITLFALGGVTTYPPPADLTPGRRFLIAAAGSALAITFGIPVLLAFRADVFADRTIELIAVGFWVATVFWGLLNWAPIRPLDGGQMLTSALQIFFPNAGTMAARIISGAFTAAAVFWLYQSGQEFAAFYVAMIGLVGLRDDPGAVAEPQASPSQAPAESHPDEVPADEAEWEAPPEFPL